MLEYLPGIHRFEILPHLIALGLALFSVYLWCLK